MSNNKQPSTIDRFLNLSFHIGKFASAIFLVIFLLLFFFSTYNIVFEKKMQPPKFQDIENTLDFKNDNGKEVKSDQKPDKSIERLETILRKYELSKYTEGISKALADKDHRTLFLDGLDDYLEEAEKYYIKNKISIDKEAYFLKCISTYIHSFAQEVTKEETNQLQAQIQKTAMWSLLIFSMMAFVLTIVMPALIRIEENTRKQ
ncbi:hypothetical protein [Akkermansia sp.]|uniref:hypothetical protein n=1 Tax=Akkermansia sp. TaxID=1872421 RepID=UPI0039931011